MYLVVSLYPSLIAYYPAKYIIQKKCDEAVDESLVALKLIPDQFVTSKVIKNFLTTLFADENMLYFNENSGDVTFCCDKMGILSVNLNNINLDNYFDKDDPDTIILIRILACHIKFEKHKAFKKR